METKCVRLKIKPGSLEAVREWARTINDRREEALQTLRDESVSVESVFLGSTSDGDFLIYYMRGTDLAAARKVADSSRHAIDDYHRHFMRTHLEKGVPLELLVELET